MKIITWVLFLIFIIEGISKLVGVPFQVQGFENWGYPLWFMYTIGVLETAGAIGLLILRLSLLANIGLLGLMVGAFYTHISKGDPFYFMIAAIIASILLITRLIIWKKMRRTSLTYHPSNSSL
ncbi:DoxX family protein [Candidatus Parcubacteria bacterium]|nr:DoxX family protein [Candidatus Parcubacteria bacterium]